MIRLARLPARMVYWNKPPTKGKCAMDIRELKYILTLAEYKNLTRAADALFISQSALSHYVKSVETALGAPLFDRSTSPLSLTHAGRCYLESAQRILLEEEKLQKEIRDITQHMHGTLKIGLASDRLSYMLPRLLPAFTQTYPGIEVRVLSGSGQSLIAALRQGEADLIFLSDGMEFAQQGLESEVLYSEEMVLAVKRGTLPQGMLRPGGAHAIDPRGLAKMPLFMLPQGHGSRAFCDAFFRRLRIRPAIYMELPSNITCYRMAATGMGGAIIPYMTTHLTVPQDAADLFSLDDPPVTWNIRILYRKGAYIGQPERDLIQMSKRIFARESLLHG